MHSNAQIEESLRTDFVKRHLIKVQLSKGHCSQNDWCSGKRDKLLKNLRSVIDTPIYPKKTFLLPIHFFHLNSDKLVCYYFTVILKFTGLLFRLSKKWCKYFIQKTKRKKLLISNTLKKLHFIERTVTDSFFSVCNSNKKFKLQLWYVFYDFIAY